MAALGLGCLCLVLSLGLTGSRLAAGKLSGSSDSGSWWDRDPLHIGKRAVDYRKLGDFHSAAAVYHEGYEAALVLGETQAAVRFLMSEGGCHQLQFHHQDALSTYLAARDLASSIHDSEDLGGIALNLSSVYLQVFDKSAALQAAETGLASIPPNGRAYWRAQLLLQLGRIRAMLGAPDAAKYFAEGVEAAREQGARPLEAMGWDLLGEQQLADRQWSAAERSLGEAFRLRVLFKLTGDLGYSYAHLGALKLAQGELHDALRFTGQALAYTRRGVSWPEYLLLHQRARIHLARGEVVVALSDYSQALEAVTHWRLDVLPARSSLTSANIALERDIFHSFIELSASYAVRTGDVSWRQKSFQAVELNRAASLRESLALARGWREKLPPAYWDLLGELAETEAAGKGKRNDQNRVRRLRLKLTEMEATTGLRIPPNKDETFASRASLIHFQAGLRDSELLLSFFLGRKESYVWTVSRHSLRLYKLAEEKEIAARVQAFREALAAGTAEAAAEGDRLYRTLFGQLNPEDRNKTAWLLSLDGALFEVPFAALVSERHSNAEGQDSKPVYLVERHSLQSVPGALLLGESRKFGKPGLSGKPGDASENAWFLGVGDPVYNHADERWRGRQWSRPQLELERLVGSGQEVLASGRSWQANAGRAMVLTGAEANRDRFLALLKTHTPRVVHLATHVIAPMPARGAAAEALDQGTIVFGLQPAGIPAARNAQTQLLTPAEIATLDVRGALVVMTGCASGVGDAQAGAGLLGLVRAWMMAGAGTVIATAWPVEDNSGELFSRFYRYLGTNSAAEALQRTQVEMAHEASWRSTPVNWASYQVSGGDR